MKVTISADVQHVFGKRAFKQTLKTSDKTVAITQSGPLIAQFKDAIEKARGNPTQHLDEYLTHIQAVLRQAKSDPTADPAAIDGIEDEALDRLMKAHGVQHVEQLPADAEAQVVRTYKVATGRLTKFAAPLEEYIASRKVEPKTEAKDRHAVT